MEHSENTNENIIKTDPEKKDLKPHFFWSFITIFAVAISTGYGSQVKYSLLNDNPKHFFAPYTMMCQITCSSAHLFSGKDGSFKFSSFLFKELFFLFLYVCGNYSYALSLGKITSSAALVIRSFEVSVVYIFGRIVLKDKFNIFKTIAVFLAIFGVIFIALDKEFAANIFGFLLVVFSCISFKFVAGENTSLGEGMLFLSGMAVVNLIFNFLPTAILINYNYDIWQWDHVPWGNFLNFVFLTFVFNIATIFGVAALGPLSIVIGILCGIPISICIDVIFRNRHLTTFFVIGAFSLIISAILANFHKEIKNLFKKEKKDNLEIIL